MKMTKEEFLHILHKWKTNTGLFSPFFKTNQLVSLSYMENLQKVNIKVNNDLKKSLEDVIKGVNLKNTLLIIDHSQHLLISYLLNNHYHIKPILLMNNFIFHERCFINNGDYGNVLYSISHLLYIKEDHKGFAFVVDYNRYLNEQNRNDEDFFLNEYEISMMDMPSYEFIKKNTGIKNILFLTDKETIKEDMDNILHYYQKYLNVKRCFIS